MGNSVYKYFSADVFQFVFKDNEYIHLKCSLPKDYNDPYELFLGIDLSADVECLSTYKALLGDIPQLYTTCFSSSGSSSPMWAHYAKNHSGFVVEFDIDSLKENLPGSFIKEVTYRDTPDDSILGHLQRATVTGKARHAMWMMDALIHHAYFTKQVCWSYEEEQRLVGINKSVVGGIISIKNSCIKSIISGKNAESSFDEIISSFASKIDVISYKECIGRSYPKPFFRNKNGLSCVESSSGICSSPFSCEECDEPTMEPTGVCVWCNISDADLINASKKNMLFAIERMGGLDEYVKQFRAVGKKK